MKASQLTRGRVLLVLGGALLSLGALAGCSRDEVARGFLPADAVGATNQTDRITSLWNGAWVAALAIGLLVWGLLLWCFVAYRKKKHDRVLPVQLTYHVPLEIMYLALPLVMVGVFFAFTARDTDEIQSTAAAPDLEIQVIAKQWTWDFNYLSDDVYSTGMPAPVAATDPDPADVPTLYLPVGERVEFTVDSRDVAHSMWIPAFLYKIDAIPGQHNKYQVIPEKIGTYQGKCAELCGEAHAQMIFRVEVVSPQEYHQHMQQLRDAGQTGALPLDLSGGQAPATTSPDHGVPTTDAAGQEDS